MAKKEGEWAFPVVLRPRPEEWLFDLEHALDTVVTLPAHPQWGGAALIGADGKLLGIGSLLVQEKVDTSTLQGNMIVPIDILAPILDDMVKLGRPSRPPRPWLGLYVTEAGPRLVVARLPPAGPAEEAGIKVGDTARDLARAGTSQPA